MRHTKQSELLMAQFMREIGLDPDKDENLKDTPVRFSKMICELTRNYKTEPKFVDKVNYDSHKEIKSTVFSAEGADELVIVRDISVSSICGHHLMPFFGTMHIGYLPKDKIIGLSKLGRIADYYCARPQTQEYLTEQVATCLMKQTDARFVGVVMHAVHTCMSCRGAKKIGATTITSKFMPNDMKETKVEFLNLVR